MPTKLIIRILTKRRLQVKENFKKGLFTIVLIKYGQAYNEYRMCWILIEL